MLPELFRILGAPIWSYGFMLATAFTIGLWLTVRFAGEDGLPAEKVYNVGLALIPSALLGAQLMTLLDAGPVPAGYRLKPFSFTTLSGSGSYLGGFLMAL